MNRLFNMNRLFASTITIFNFSALTLLLSIASSAHADRGESRTLPEQRPAEGMAEQKPSIGISTGVADTQNGRRNATSWGIEYAFQPYIPYSAAVQLNGYVSDHTGNSPTLTRTELLYKTAYNFGGDIPFIKFTYLGGLLGPVFDNIEGTTDVNLGIAPVAGFDIPLRDWAPHLSLGANASYLFLIGPKPDVFALNGTVKYWF